MKWYTLLVHTGIEPMEALFKANSEDEAVNKAKTYHGNDVLIEVLKKGVS